MLLGLIRLYLGRGLVALGFGYSNGSPIVVVSEPGCGTIAVTALASATVAITPTATANVSIEAC